MKRNFQLRILIVSIFVPSFLLSQGPGANREFMSTSIKLKSNSSTPGPEIIPVIEIKENRYARWRPVKENKLARRSLFSNYQLVNNGTAFGEMPSRGTFNGQEPVRGYQGQYLANSKFNNLGTTIGELLSDTFTIKGDRIDFLIGGGNFKGLAGLYLLVNNVVVRSASGDYSSTMARKSWDVSAYKGSAAQLLIRDKISKDLFCFPPFDSTKDNFAFILVDDIRQTDGNAKLVDPAYDKEHNFDFESVLPSRYKIYSKKITENPSESVALFDVFESGSKLGTFRYSLKKALVKKSLYKLEHEWLYSGDSMAGVKLRITNSIPVAPANTQYYVLPGLLYNGNDIGIRAHYLNENIPEDAETIPGAYSVEDKTRIYSGWVRPQESSADPRFSLQLGKGKNEKSWLATYSVPASVNLAVHDSIAQDEDPRFVVHDGFKLKKTTFLYQDMKRTYSSVSNEKAGYGQMVNEAWKMFYPGSGTNPPYSLTDDYRLKMKSLLDPKALVQEVSINEKKYRIWIVGRHILGKDFDFTSSELVPTKHIFFYTGFSWSGMLETAAYNGIKEYLRTHDSSGLNLSVHSLDFFADNGMSPIGILYPNWDSAIGFSSVWSKEVIDIGHLGDGLSGFIKCYRLMKDHNIETKSNWLSVVKTSLDNIMLKFPDGDIPGRIHSTSGEAASRDGILYKPPSRGGPNGINFLIWAFVDYYNLTHERKYLDYAEKMGDIVLKVMAKYGVMSGMEADYFNVDKRMYHGALAAFNKLYENTSNKKWLEASLLAGNGFGSWEYCYNVNFDDYPETPNGYFDYRSIGGTPVDIKYSTNNTNFQQGATEFLKLWRFTGDHMWFDRARAILHQGTQLSLTEEKRKWLNENFQNVKVSKDKNRSNTFDEHVLGGGTEDVMMSWLFKGIWTSKNGGILSMYMFTQGFDSNDLLEEYGSLCYNYKWDNGGAIDVLDSVKIFKEKNNNFLRISAHNMLSRPVVYKLRLMECPHKSVIIDGKTYSKAEIDEGILIQFGQDENKVINIYYHE